VLGVEIQSEQKRTLVTLDGTSTPSPPAPPSTQGKVDINNPVALDETAIETHIREKKWSDSELNAFLTFNKWDRTELLDHLANDRRKNPQTSGHVYAMRTKVGLFGNNAPYYDSLPASLRFGEWGFFDVNDQNLWMFKDPAYPQPWEGMSITKDSQGVDYTAADFFLERSVPGLINGDWLVLEDSNAKAYKIKQIVETSLADYGMSAKVTGVKVYDATGLSSYDVRETTAYVQSEPLALTEFPFSEQLVSDPDRLLLDRVVLGLTTGRPVILSGERLDLPGVVESETLLVKEINHIDGFTELTFEKGRQYPYKRSTVTINANVAAATHGETITEILGNGNGAQANQKFTLRKPPLTYIPAATPGGSASTLKLRVNNLLWDEHPSLYTLDHNDESYTTRIDDDGKATVIFGDGEKGARLPTGINNVVATYRSGIGLAGEVDAGALTILQSRPLGVRSVTNPLAAGGAGDPEKMEKARDNAPLTVRTLDRIVSRQDYEDFARAFAGIGKAQAVELWESHSRIVHITIAGANAKPITDENFLKNFGDALDAVRDPAQRVMVGTFDPGLFNLSANVAVDRRYITSDVFKAIESGLGEAFSFANRSFGQAVTAAEVITTMQNIAGVVYVDLDSLYLSCQSAAPNQILPANMAYVKNGTIQPARLLLINTLGIKLQEVQA
jgi:hypothetical protein